MLSLLKETWDRVQAELRAKAGAAAYDAWLADLRPLALERGTVYLEARNSMGCERVRRLYTPLLEDCLSAGIGTRLAVEVAPAPESLLGDALEVSPEQPVLDRGNSTAFLALQQVLAPNPGIPARMFCFYGPPGVGKTYLLRWWRDRAPGKVRIHDGEKLRDAFMLKIRDHALVDLWAELSTDAPLVIDGVHRFTRHTRAQAELRGILRQREARGQLTLVTSRFHPHDIWELEPALTSLLLSGFVHELKLPGHRARLRFLRALEGKASSNGRAEVIETMARQVQGSYSDLRRAWTLERHDLAHPRHSNYLELIDPSREFRRLRDRVAEQLQIPVEELLGKGQQRRVTLARQVLAWLAWRAGLSQAEVGRYMNGRTRASISYCIKTIEKRMAESAETRQLVEGLL